MPTTAAVPYITELEGMTPKQLLSEYNRISPTKRRMAFRTTAEAVKRIIAAVQANSTTVQADAAPAKTKAVTSPPKIKGSKREPKNVRARMADVVIRITPPNGEGPDWNPRREDTAAHKHFEAMKGGITVRQYLAKFAEKDQRTARQWLWNTIQDGHVKTLGA